MRFLKIVLADLYLRLLRWLTIIQPPRKSCHLTLGTEIPNRTDIVTVAFNNAELIRLQHATFRKNLVEPYHQIIVDNSTDQRVRAELFAFCKKEGLTYLGMPKNFLNRSGSSRSHAMALNYVYKRLIRQRQPAIFGITDHDLFPVRTVAISQLLDNQPFYGLLRQREPFWYISPILSFFRWDFIKNRHIDFFPIIEKSIYLDTGGGNWKSIFSQFDKALLHFPKEEIAPLHGEVADNYWTETLAWIGDRQWLHTINGSLWAPDSTFAPEKRDAIMSILNG